MSLPYDPERKVWSGIRRPGLLNPQANLGPVILNLLERTPTRIAQVSVESGVTVSCEEMRLRSIRVAQNLTALGYGKGDVIAFSARNRENVAPVVYGCFMIGAPVNCVDPDFKISDVINMLSVTKPVLVIADEDNEELIKEACKEVDLSPRYVVADKASNGVDLSISDLVQKTGEEDLFIPKYLGDSEELVAAIFCSSGSTGMPKEMCMSHATLIDWTNSVRKPTCSFTFESLFPVTAVQGLIQVLFDNATRYVTLRQFNPEAFFEIVEQYKLTSVSMPPAQVAAVMRSPVFAKADLSRLESFITQGGPFSVEMRKALQKRCPSLFIRLGYGATEIGFIASNAFAPLEREGSVGMLGPNTQSKVLDDNGNQLGVNEPGVLWIKKPFRALGYLNNQADTEALISPDGWVCTGDVCYFDEDGYLFVVDRKKEILRVMNNPVSPAEVQATIEQLPEVQQACVVGLFDPEHQEDLVTAVVKLRVGFNLSERAVVEHVANNLADYKHLRGGVFFVDEMPMTRTGKVKRSDVRKIAEQRAKSA